MHPSFSYSLLITAPPLFFLSCFLPTENASVPQFEEAVPGSCADAQSICRDAGAAHPVVMAREHTWKKQIKLFTKQSIHLTFLVSVCIYRN